MGCSICPSAVARSELEQALDASAAKARATRGKRLAGARRAHRKCAWLEKERSMNRPFSPRDNGGTAPLALLGPRGLCLRQNFATRVSARERACRSQTLNSGSPTENSASPGQRRALAVNRRTAHRTCRCRADEHRDPRHRVSRASAQERGLPRARTAQTPRTPKTRRPGGLGAGRFKSGRVVFQKPMLTVITFGARAM